MPAKIARLATRPPFWFSALLQDGRELRTATEMADRQSSGESRMGSLSPYMEDGRLAEVLLAETPRHDQGTPVGSSRRASPVCDDLIGTVHGPPAPDTPLQRAAHAWPHLRAAANLIEHSNRTDAGRGLQLGTSSASQTSKSGSDRRCLTLIAARQTGNATIASARKQRPRAGADCGSLSGWWRDGDLYCRKIGGQIVDILVFERRRHQRHHVVLARATAVVLQRFDEVNVALSGEVRCLRDLRPAIQAVASLTHQCLLPPGSHGHRPRSHRTRRMPQPHTPRQQRPPPESGAPWLTTGFSYMGYKDGAAQIPRGADDGKNRTRSSRSICRRTSSDRARRQNHPTRGASRPSVGRRLPADPNIRHSHRANLPRTARIYLRCRRGEVVHKGIAYPGEHGAIVETSLC
jgi:hypothetical protein